MKYIMFEAKLNEFTVSIPIIFPNTLVHKTVADAMEPAIAEHFPHAKMITLKSAGFYSDLGCHGKSETLGLESSPHDYNIIQTYDYAHGITA